MRNAEFTCPRTNVQRFSVVRYPTVLSHIRTLLHWRGPAAVARFVVPVIVNTVNSCLWKRFRSHVGIKSRERLSPLVANYNSSSSVVVIIGVVFVVTASFHFLPSPVLSASDHPACALAVAPTGNSSATAQVTACDFSEIPAFALTEPEQLPALFASDLDDSQSPVGFPAFVFRPRGKLLRIGVSHVNRPFRFALVRATLEHELPRGSSILDPYHTFVNAKGV